jgi:hypothetical protein
MLPRTFRGEGGIWRKAQMPQTSRPNYRQSLGAIGRYLDHNGYDSAMVCELGEGFVVRAIKGDVLPEAIPFQVSDLRDLIKQAIEEEKKRKKWKDGGTSDLSASFVRRAAGTYQNMFTALGQQFDEIECTMVMILELRDTVLVTYRTVIASSESWDAVSFEYIYDLNGVRQLLASVA